MSNILGRFLNYFLSLLLIYFYAPGATAPIQQVYVIIPFLNIIFRLGLETSYFRYSTQFEKQRLFNVLSTFLLTTTILLTGLFLLGKQVGVGLFEMDRFPQYYTYMVFILFFDTLSALPFVRLRQENRPRRYALINLLNILVNVVSVILFLVVLPWLLRSGYALPRWLYQPEIGIGYYILSNLIASIVTCFLLLPEWKGFRVEWNASWLRMILWYSIPILMVGFGGMINDFLSRIVYYKVLDEPLEVLDHEFGVFAANYKLAVLATLFIQVFKMGAEPFFFNESGNKNAPELYARIMKIFVIICSFLFLFITLNLDIFILLISSGHAAYAEGKHIVPVLTLANILLGIYYNLAIWYKLKDQTLKGAIITFIGVVITIVLNIILIPMAHYTGASWATLLCYAVMVLISFLWGQRHYPIPYETARCLTYLGVAVGLYLGITQIQLALDIHHILFSLGGFVLATGILAWLVWKLDRDELKRLPKVGRFFA